MNTEKMSDLAETFHTLVGVDGVRPFDPTVLDEAVMNALPGRGKLAAARFILNLWSYRAEWKCGPFNLFADLPEWDHLQLIAFQRWAVRPWRP